MHIWCYSSLLRLCPSVQNAVILTLILWEGLLLSALATVTSPYPRRNSRSRCPRHCDQSFQTLPWETRGQVFTKAPRAPFLPSVRRQGYQQPSLTAAPSTGSVTLSLSTLFTVLCQSTELHPFLRKYVGWRWFHFFVFLIVYLFVW